MRRCFAFVVTAIFGIVAAAPGVAAPTAVLHRSSSPSPAPAATQGAPRTSATAQAAAAQVTAAPAAPDLPTAAAADYQADPQIARLVATISAARLRATVTQLASYGTRSTFSETQHNPRRGINPARDWLVGQFKAIADQSHGRMTVSLDSYVQPQTPRTPRAVTVTSVIATLRGDEPGGRTYVISGHIDSRNTDVNDATRLAPGADDNATGIAIALEAARVMAAVPPHATVIFACFDGEEQGLWGSAHFAAQLHARNVTVAGDLNDDIVGSPAGPDGTSAQTEVRVFSEALATSADRSTVNQQGSENDSPSRELARFAQETGELYVSPMHVDLVARADRFLRGGDQESFTDQGFAAVRYTEPMENFAHQHQDVRVENGVEYGDLLKFVDFDYLRHIAQLNVATLAALAYGPSPPTGVEIVARNLSYDTVLQWTPARGATKYEIVWRRTSDFTWRYRRDVGNVATATMSGLSKDKWLFGVRSVDARGIRSVVVFPKPVQ